MYGKRGVLTTVAFVHHKGGTGKTTSCLQIAGALVRKGRRVLVIDTDPQANATIGLGVHPDTPARNIYHLYISRCQDDEPRISIDSCIVHTLSGIDLVPSHLDLAGVEVYLYQNEHRYQILGDEIAKINDRYDHILIDTPPFLGQFVINGIMAADKLVFVFSPDNFALAGYRNIRIIMQDISDIIGKSVPPGMAILNRWSEPEKPSPGGVIGWLGRHLSSPPAVPEQNSMDIRIMVENEIHDHFPAIIRIPESKLLARSLQQGIPLTIAGVSDSAADFFVQAAEIIDTWG